MTLQQAFAWIDDQRSGLIDRLMYLSEINSGTGNPAGVKKVAAEFTSSYGPLAHSLEMLPSTIMERVNIDGEPVPEHYGDILSCCKRPDAPLQVLLVGHLDTVFPAGHAFQRPWRVDADTLRGPGVADMKGGLLVMLTALQAFERLNSPENLGWRVILNADEETGSHGSVDVLLAAAEKAHAGMIYEPALADGTLSGARKGSGNFTLVAHGVSAHAGREFAKGRNAVLAVTNAAGRLAALTDQDRGITVNIARIKGGSVFNVVPDKAVCQFNIRCRTPEQQRQIRARLDAVIDEVNRTDGVRLALSGGFSRPPKTISAANQLFMDWAVECGRSLDIDVRFQDTGGCCDGNNLAAAGLPNIDTLGVLGGHIHTDQEFMLPDSLTQRAKLSLLLLERLSREGEQLQSSKEI